ncbi:MAG: hypothetical protein ACRDVL_01215 [Acidimicrobiia bacterium]
MRDFFGYALSRWPVIMVAAVLGVLASLALSALAEPMYRSTETLVIGPAFDSPAVESRDLQASERIAASYASLAKDSQFLSAVIEDIGIDTSPGELAERVELTVIPTTQLLTVNSIADTPGEAEAVTDAVSRHLVGVAGGVAGVDVDNDPVERRLESLESRIAVTEAGVVRLTGDLQRSQENLDECLERQEIIPRSCATQQESRDILAQELQRQEGLLGTLEGNYILALDLAAAAENSPGRVTRLGDGPGLAKPLAVGTPLSVMIGFLAGLILAFLILYLAWSARAHRREVRGIPTTTIGREDLELAAAGRLHPHDVAARRLDALESRWILDGDFVPQSVAVLAGSPEGTELAQSYALHLARKIAESGVKTVLIDAVFASPQLHQAVGASLFPGLAELLNGSIRSLDVAIQHTEVPGLSFLSTGWLDGPPDRRNLPSRLQGLSDDLNRSAEAVVAALSFGDRDRISKELVQWFRSSLVVTAESDGNPSSRAVIQTTRPVAPNILYIVEVQDVADQQGSRDLGRETA